jgi:3-oxoacyl-[acyl-carrier-protein] synthase-3
VEAGKKALEDAGITPEQVDLVLVGTDSRITSRQLLRWLCSTSLAASMPVPGILAAPARLFPTGLAQAAGMIASNPNLKYILVIGAYMMHKLADVKHDITAFST